MTKLNGWAKRIAKGIKILLILTVIATSCMKLDERMVLLDQHCIPCRSTLEDSLLKVRGVYWAKYFPEKASVKIKFSPKEFDSAGFHEFLGSRGFMQLGDTLAPLPLPKCCKPKE